MDELDFTRERHYHKSYAELNISKIFMYYEQHMFAD